MSAITTIEAVEGIVSAIRHELDGLASFAAEAMVTEEEAVTLLAAHHDIAEALNQIRHAAERLLLDLTPAGYAEGYPGLGVVEHRAGGKQRTQGARLAQMVASRVADMPCDEDGVALPPGELCRRVADRLTEVFGLDNESASFRRQRVTRMHLRPDDFVSWESGTPKITFRRTS